MTIMRRLPETLIATDKPERRGLTDLQRLMLAVVRAHNVKTGEAINTMDAVDEIKALLKKHGDPVTALRAVTGALS